MDGAAEGLNGARSSGWPSLEPENQRGQFASPPWQKPSSNFGHRHSAWSPSEPRKSAVAFFYNRGLLVRSTAHEGACPGDDGLVPRHDQE